MNIAFVGIGKVGSSLAFNLSKVGHNVAIAARNPNSDSVKAAQGRNPKLIVLPVKKAIDEAEVVFLATPFGAVKEALSEAGDMTGKILVDCTNPVGQGLTHGLNNEISGGEYVQILVPRARVVKAFTIYGYENLADNKYTAYGDLKPAMLIAGNDVAAKRTVGSLCEQLEWEPVDTGDISMSLHLEHMTLLWIKMGRVQGLGPNFVWARLKR